MADDDATPEAAPDPVEAAATIVSRITGTIPDPSPDEPKRFTAGSKPVYERATTTVIRRKKIVRHGGHAAAWKIAYADFVTAMMAFFLLLWLLTSTNQGDLQGIADYFNRPLEALFTQGPGASSSTTPEAGQAQHVEREQLEQLRTRLTTLIERTPALQAYKNQIKIDVTSEGLRIQILDDKNRPMFDRGDAELKDYTQAILAQIGPTLNDVPNHISIAGHTDATPYSGDADGYSNWELSTERANAARRALVAAGMNDSKVLQVRGLADSIPLIPNDPTNPANRRITIVVLNKAAEDTFRRDGAPEPDAAAQDSDK